MKEQREKRNTYLQFRQAVYLLESDSEDFKNCNDRAKNYNPLLPFLYLIMGIFSIILSILWIIQTILYVLPNPPLHPFLNQYFLFFEEDFPFPLISVVSFGVMVSYLMISAIKGCFKFGLRFFCCKLHPMQVNKTYMSSFLFNMVLILLCVLPCVQFATTAFGTYAQYSSASQLFGTQMRYMKFFGLFWEYDVFFWAWISFVFLTAVYLTCKPRETRNDGTILCEQMKRRHDVE